MRANFQLTMKQGNIWLRFSSCQYRQHFPRKTLIQWLYYFNQLLNYKFMCRIWYYRKHMQSLIVLRMSTSNAYYSCNYKNNFASHKINSQKQKYHAQVYMYELQQLSVIRPLFFNLHWEFHHIKINNVILIN